ncbi:MAG: sulfatase-like hydrolase/transferase [Chloroflexota bacterium]|nr:sulfatase-like hydrolase/transferase [Chloroflexota bacterium]
MASAGRPNILCICTDQQRYDALGAYGNGTIRTPGIDGLARDGVLFERCYVQSPVCAPARASLVTGRYVHAHGLWANGVALPGHLPLFPRALADAGYDCGLIGKLHLAAAFGGRTESRLDDGFRFFAWSHDPSHPSPENAYHRWLEARFPEQYAAATAPGAGRRGHEPGRFDAMPTEAHYSRWVRETAVEFLRLERDPDKPFFLWANFYDPHHPFVVPREYLDRYDPATLPTPIDEPAGLAGKPPVQAEASRESYAGKARGFADYSPEELREAIRAYYAMVTLVDDETRAILAALDELGLAEDTLVVFTSDHGEMLGDHRLMLKGPMLYEPAVRVPLILRWPGRLPAGERRPEIVEWIDLCPSFLAAAGLPPLLGNQGLDLLPLARGEGDATRRDWALCEYRDSGHPYEPSVHVTMLVRGRYKLNVYHGLPATERERTGELYDLEADPDELSNLWDDPAHASVRVELEEFLLDTLVATEDRSQPREAFW